MTINESRLVVAMNDCNNLSEEISRCLRFGPDNNYPSLGTSNKVRVMKKYYELCATIAMLQSEELLPTLGSCVVKEVITEKKESIKNWEQYMEREHFYEMQ